MSEERPGEIAVSLRYEGDGAPRVTAKGEGDIARRILEVATEYDIPIYRDGQLSRLLSQVELDEEIPASLYVAVAEIIAFAYALKDRVPAPHTVDGSGPVIDPEAGEYD